MKVNSKQRMLMAKQDDDDENDGNVTPLVL